MASKTEQLLEAVKALLVSVPNVKVERNTALPEKIHAGGLIVLRDGNPGDPEQALGGFGSVYYSQDVEIEVYVEDGDAATRDTAFDTLLQQIGSVLDADPTLGGLAFGMTYGRPEVHTEAVTGAPAIKAGTLTVTIEFETDSPLG
ncbi:MAG: acyl-CoA transferase [Boseongicola sp.]|nr:acyl-CoA transferase [Boseongicola sp.]MDD9976508.1 acyl-CoA transferase [Boseongicola sp.]